jgi:hypothetical protein
MSEEPAVESQVAETSTPKPWYRRELFIFIAGSIIVAFFLVVISMELYTSSGASLLDLSRPGYKSVQSKVDDADSFEAFSSDGVVTKATLDQFQQLYAKQVKSVSNSLDYDSTPLSDQALGIEDPQTDQ